MGPLAHAGPRANAPLPIGYSVPRHHSHTRHQYILTPTLPPGFRSPKSSEY